MAWSSPFPLDAALGFVTGLAAAPLPPGTPVPTALDGFRAFGCAAREGWPAVVACVGEWEHAFALAAPLQAPFTGPAMAAIAWDFASRYRRGVGGRLESGDGQGAWGVLESGGEPEAAEVVIAGAGQVVGGAKAVAADRVGAGGRAADGGSGDAGVGARNSAAESGGAAENSRAGSSSAATPPLGTSAAALDSCASLGNLLPFRLAAMLSPGLIAEFTRRYPVAGGSLLTAVALGMGAWAALVIALGRAGVRCASAWRATGCAGANARGVSGNRLSLR